MFFLRSETCEKSIFGIIYERTVRISRLRGCMYVARRLKIDVF